MYSNLEDLAKWDEALRVNELLSPGAMRPGLTPVTLAGGSAAHWPAGPVSGDDLRPGQPVSYGFGWLLDPWRGRTRMWHHGETTGFRTVIERFPDDGLTVVVLANRDDLDVRALGRLQRPRWVSPARHLRDVRAAGLRERARGRTQQLQRLGLSRKALWERRKRFGIPRPSAKPSRYVR